MTTPQQQYDPRQQQGAYTPQHYAPYAPPPAPRTQQHAAPPQPKRQHINWEPLIWTAAGALASGFLAALLWLVAAWFTSHAIADIAERFGYALDVSGRRFVVLPLIFSIIEITAWRQLWHARRQAGWAILALGILVAVLDYGSVTYGIALALDGAHLPLFTGFDIPEMKAAPAAVGLGMGGALLLTFGPERVLIAAVEQLVVVYRVLSGMWKGQ